MRQVAIAISALLVISALLLFDLAAMSVQAEEERKGVPGRRVGGGTRCYQDTRSPSFSSKFLPTPGTASKSASD